MDNCIDKCKAAIQGVRGESCKGDLCTVVEEFLDSYCHAQGLEPGTPVPQIQDGKLCYCCCYCHIPELAAAISEKEFSFLRDISEGDSVLVYNLDLEFKPDTVNYISGATRYDGAGQLRYVAYQYDDEVRKLVVTPDQMFLMRSGKLKAARHLLAGDELQRADGGVSRVKYSETYKGQVDVYHIGVGDGGAGRLDGHLVNLNGIVCGDFSVQVGYFAGRLDATMLEPLHPFNPLTAV